MNRIEELICQAQAGDTTASETLILENSGLIWSIARRFMGRGVETDDLYQLGCVGFLKAVEGFDTEFGTQFSTYAVPKISGEIRRFLRDDGTIKVSRGIKEQAASIRSMRNKLTALLGREPSIQEISDQIGISPEDIAIAETATAAAESIQQETGEEGFTLENVLTDTESEEKLVEKIALRQVIQNLPEKEKTVIQLRYYHSLTQQRVAKVMNISQVQVSRIEKRALQRIREILQ